MDGVGDAEGGKKELLDFLDAVLYFSTDVFMDGDRMDADSSYGK